MNVKPQANRNFLKFCYFLAAFLLLACGNKQERETKENEQGSTAPTTTAQSSANKTILCFGDSITAGYGLEDVNDAYPGILQARIDSLGLGYQVVNSGVSGETTAGGRSRIEWVLNQPVQIFILELGGNDGLRGIPLSQTRTNLQAIIDAVQQKYPEATVILAGMEIPPNMGQEYTAEFREVYAQLARENNLVFIPFILEGVGGVPALNQDDGIHPTARGHEIVANTVWAALKPLLKSS